VPLLVAIIAILVVGGGVYVYENKKAEVSTPIDYTSQQQNQIQNVSTVSSDTNKLPTKSVSTLAPDVPCPGGLEESEYIFDTS